MVHILSWMIFKRRKKKKMSIFFMVKEKNDYLIATNVVVARDLIVDLIPIDIFSWHFHYCQVQCLSKASLFP
jgi:hypothetical protein